MIFFMNEYKILFTGTMGAGKTTAIATVSEITPVVTDVKNMDESVDKARTTVGLDYGEVTLDGGDKLRLYGTPGQKRFSFMWQILSTGALGLIILIDNSRPKPLADLTEYLDGFAELIGRASFVVGVGRSATAGSPSLDEFADVMATRNLMAPVVPVDVRERADVLMMIDLLLTQLELRE
jgi:uncharacterized protein